MSRQNEKRQKCIKCIAEDIFYEKEFGKYTGKRETLFEQAISLNLQGFHMDESLISLCALNRIPWTLSGGVSWA